MPWARSRCIRAFSRRRTRRPRRRAGGRCKNLLTIATSMSGSSRRSRRKCAFTCWLQPAVTSANLYVFARLRYAGALIESTRWVSKFGMPAGATALAAYN